MTKQYRPDLTKRVADIRSGIEPQPLASLWNVDVTLRDDQVKLRRILSGKVFPGDIPFIARMEKAKARLLKARK